MPRKQGRTQELIRAMVRNVHHAMAVPHVEEPILSLPIDFGGLVRIRPDRHDVRLCFLEDGRW